LRTKRDFTQNALRNYDKWNEQWGLTERNTAVGQAQMAVKWDEIERDKDILPYLRYVTVGDDLVSDICQPLNGIVAKVDDPIWASVSPLNHFNCRCLLLQEDKYSANLSPANKKKEAYEATLSQMQDEFKMNSGKDGYIFSPEHPYLTFGQKTRSTQKIILGF
jgi:SPP1 gp7 family putative phage head morphogenesis protein